MSKKNDLKLVFDFIAEYLQEETKDKIETSSEKQVLVETPDVEIPRYQVDNLGHLSSPTSIAHIKNLIDRVEQKGAETATTHHLLNEQRKEFAQEIKKIKEKISEDLQTEKLNEEGLIVSGDTANVVIENVIENDIEKTVIDSDMVKPKIKRKVRN